MTETEINTGIARAHRDASWARLKESAEDAREALTPTALAERGQLATRRRIGDALEVSQSAAFRNRGKLIAFGVAAGAYFAARPLIRRFRRRKKGE